MNLLIYLKEMDRRLEAIIGQTIDFGQKLQSMGDLFPLFPFFVDKRPYSILTAVITTIINI